MTPHAHRVHVPPREPEPESLAMLLIGGAALLLWAFFLLFLLPGLA